VASISRLLKIIGLFCKRALQKRPIFCKETYNFKEPTIRSHPPKRCPLIRIYHTTHSYTTSRICTCHDCTYVVASTTVSATHMHHVTNTNHVTNTHCVTNMHHITHMNHICVYHLTHINQGTHTNHEYTILCSSKWGREIHIFKHRHHCTPYTPFSNATTCPRHGPRHRKKRRRKRRRTRARVVRGGTGGVVEEKGGQIPPKMRRKRMVLRLCVLTASAAARCFYICGMAWLIHMCFMMNLHVWYAAFMCVESRVCIYMFDNSSVCVV